MPAEAHHPMTSPSPRLCLLNILLSRRKDTIGEKSCIDVAGRGEEAVSETYGTAEWFEARFRLSDDDPWGNDWRGIEQYRHERMARLMRRVVLGETRGNNELKVLDIGCSTGDFTKRLYELNLNVTGIDICQTAVDRAKAKFSYIDFRKDAFPKSCFRENTFDFITCPEVLYYMDKQTQKEVLIEIGHLLKNNGKALITSMIGEKPYFLPEELLRLLSDHFQIEKIEYYGARAYYRIEARFFQKLEQIEKVKRLFTLRPDELRGELDRFKGRGKEVIEKIICAVVRFKCLQLLAPIALRILKGSIRSALRCYVGARVAHSIAEMLSLRRTHTFVLVGKKDGQ